VNLADVRGKAAAAPACPSENVRDNFMLYHPPPLQQGPTLPALSLVAPDGTVGLPGTNLASADANLVVLPSRSPFPSKDASFLVACANNRPSYIKGSDLVVIVRGHLPRTPHGLYDAPYVGDPWVREWSFCVYVYVCMSDQTLMCVSIPLSPSQDDM
jgi:hypothetical protein